MPTRDELLKDFRALFGDRGGDVLPGNTGLSRSAATVCRGLMTVQEPVLYEYFRAWDERPEQERTPYAVVQSLAAIGQWEGAWALAQLHHDQLLKQESRTAGKEHKGNLLCNIALLGRTIRSPSLARHYAMLSSAGDVYWEKRDPNLRYGGLAPTLLEPFESQREHEAWRDKVRSELAKLGDDKPLYLEAFLAMRWFTDAYARFVLDLSSVRNREGKPFPDVLLDAVEKPGGASDAATGTRFEAAAAMLMDRTPSFQVDSGRKTTDEQVDLVVYYSSDTLSSFGLNTGCGLIECKSGAGRVKSRELRDFGAKCIFHRVNFGILIAREGTTGGSGKFEEPQNAELVRRRFQLDGVTLLVLSIEQLKGKSQDLRGLQDALSADYKELVYGPRA